MADGKLYRLITVGLWLSLVAGVGVWGLIIYAANTGNIDSMEVIDLVLFQDGLVDALVLWAYPIMLGVQYVVEGEYKWFPWNR